MGEGGGSRSRRSGGPRQYCGRTWGPSWASSRCQRRLRLAARSLRFAQLRQVPPPLAWCRANSFFLATQMLPCRDRPGAQLRPLSSNCRASWWSASLQRPLAEFGGLAASGTAARPLKQVLHYRCSKPTVYRRRCQNILYCTCCWELHCASALLLLSLCMKGTLKHNRRTPASGPWKIKGRSVSLQDRGHCHLPLQSLVQHVLWCIGGAFEQCPWHPRRPGLCRQVPEREPRAQHMQACIGPPRHKLGLDSFAMSKPDAQYM